MDLTITLVGLALLALFVVPVIWIQRSQAKKSKESLSEFKKQALQHGINIGESDFWNHYFIGIDSSAGKVFYLNNRETGKYVETIDLSEISRCKVINTGRTVKISNGHSAVIERLQLSFIPVGSKQKEKTVEFYNAEVKPSPGNELQLVEKWENRINSYLKNKK